MEASMELVKVKSEVEVKQEPEDLENDSFEEDQSEEFNSLGETEYLLPVKTEPDLSSTAEPANINEANGFFESTVKEEDEYILSDNPFPPKIPAENHQQSSTATQLIASLVKDNPKINFGFFRTQFKKKIESSNYPETPAENNDCPFPCTYCKAKFKRINDRSKHLVNCSARNSARERNMANLPFVCVFCGLKFKLLSQRTKHLSFCTAAINSLREKANDNNDDSSYTCEYCGLKYKAQKAFVRHLSLCIDEKCSAGVNFNTQASTDKPGSEKEENCLENKLSSDLAESTSRQFLHNVYACHKCFAEFDDKCQLQEHFNMQHLTVPKSSSEANLKRPAKEDFSKPFKYYGITFNVKNLNESSKVGNSQNPAQDVRPFPCTHCGTRFKLQRNLKAHLLTCADPINSKKLDLQALAEKELLTFTYGGLKYKLQKNLLQNPSGASAGASEDRPFACKHCRIKFRLQKDLIKHHSVCSKAKSLTGANAEAGGAFDEYRPFICVNCGMKYLSRKDLYQHLASCNVAKCSTENNPKPIEVDVDEPVIKTEEISSFESSRDTLKLSGDTNELFSCHKCDAEFVEKSELQLHFQKHRQINGFPYTCAECGMKFKRPHNYEKHIAMHAKPFMCNVCSFSFDSLFLLEEHAAIHPPEVESTSIDANNFSIKHKQVFECGVCRVVFAEASLLKQHVSTHSEEYYSCSQCPVKLRSKGVLKKHEEQHSNEKRFECDECPATFKIARNLEAHVRLHSESLASRAESLACEWCSVTFTTVAELANHLIVHTREKDYLCKDCGRGFTQPAKLEKHRLTHADGKPFSCPHCPKNYTDLHSLKMHVRTHSGKNLYACEYCTATFAQLNGLRVHTRTHTRDKPFACSYCPIRFSQKKDLQTHLRMHSGAKPYVCNLCSNTFRQLSDFQKHTATHMGDKQFSCDQCPATFDRANKLNQHKQKHQKKFKEKFYRCTECDKRFSRKALLQAHLRTHTESHPLYCDYCSAVFDRKSLLEKHIRTHTGERPYTCAHCEAHFSQKNTLVLHERTHTEEKPYTCSHCAKKFSRRGTWLGHLKTHSGEICLVQVNDKSTLQKNLRTHNGGKFFDETLCEKIIGEGESD